MTEKAHPPRHKRITVLVNPEESALIDTIAVEQGISRSDVIRGGVRHYPRTHPLPLPAANGIRRSA